MANFIAPQRIALQMKQMIITVRMRPILRWDWPQILDFQLDYGANHN
jgi:hypothetical protein